MTPLGVSAPVPLPRFSPCRAANWRWRSASFCARLGVRLVILGLGGPWVPQVACSQSVLSHGSSDMSGFGSPFFRSSALPSAPSGCSEGHPNPSDTPSGEGGGGALEVVPATFGWSLASYAFHLAAHFSWGPFRYCCSFGVRPRGGVLIF
jgi:hypothetical protein